MRYLLILLLIACAIQVVGQKFNITYYKGNDVLGFSGNYYYGDTLPDTCIWNIIQKCDTCTQSDYDCDCHDVSRTASPGDTWYCIDSCKALGWTTVVLNTVADTVTVALRSINKPVTLYIRGVPTHVNGLPIWDMYVLILPRNTGVMKYNTKALKKGTLLYSTLRHDIYSFEREYVDISDTVRSVPYTYTATVYNDTTLCSCLTMSDTAYFGRVVSDTLYWSTSDQWGGKSYSDEITMVHEPTSTIDVVYYVKHPTYQGCCNGDCTKRWYMPFTGINHTYRISVWP